MSGLAHTGARELGGPHEVAIVEIVDSTQDSSTWVLSSDRDAARRTLLALREPDVDAGGAESVKIRANCWVAHLMIKQIRKR